MMTKLEAPLWLLLIAMCFFAATVTDLGAQTFLLRGVVAFAALRGILALKAWLPNA